MKILEHSLFGSIKSFRSKIFFFFSPYNCSINCSGCLVRTLFLQKGCSALYSSSLMANKVFCSALPAFCCVPFTSSSTELATKITWKLFVWKVAHQKNVILSWISSCEDTVYKHWCQHRDGSRSDGWRSMLEHSSCWEHCLRKSD